MYCLKLLPFGGACVMEGEDGESESEHAFGRARLRRRILIVAAGALMNFLIGFVILLFAVQAPTDNGFITTTVASISEGQLGARGRLAGGRHDHQHRRLPTARAQRSERRDGYEQLDDAQRQGAPRRRDGRAAVCAVRGAHRRRRGRKADRLTFGATPDTLVSRVQHAALTALDDARLVWVSLGQLLGGRVGVNDLAGPVGVASTMAVTARVNIRAFLQLVAFISINLGVMNLLPLPALDGGRLVFLIIEGIRRKPVPPKYEGLVHAAGLMLLLMLMVYVTGHDILRLLTGRMMQ